MYRCPLCEGYSETSIRRRSLPVFNNVTYSSRYEAENAPVGEFLLATCQSCGFSYNCEFNSELVTYGEGYDNQIESVIFRTYYDELIRRIADYVSLDRGIVYDIGCGTGEFLTALCAKHGNMSGIGIDPTCQPSETGNVRLINSTFENSVIDSRANLVIVRHVLEHLIDPLSFLKNLQKQIRDATVFVEVPDFDWILANGAIWDFTYEHCNYFTLSTLRLALEKAGFEVSEQRNSFGNQYQYAICSPGRPSTRSRDGADTTIGAVQTYATLEALRISDVRQLAEGEEHFVLWGMSGKGVILASLLPKGSVQGGVDMNTAKQGRFAAASGVEIHPPEWLGGLVASTVAIMNPNYASEITALVKQLDANVQLISI
mgnify:FL=1